MKIERATLGCGVCFVTGVCVHKRVMKQFCLRSLFCDTGMCVQKSDA
jgi:hypothetical protein